MSQDGNQTPNTLFEQEPNVGKKTKGRDRADEKKVPPDEDYRIRNVSVMNVLRKICPRTLSSLSQMRGITAAATTKDLREMYLELEQIDPNLYRGEHLQRGRKSRDAVYGGQVIAQSLNAAARTVDEEYLPHSFHSYFIKTGSVDHPVLYSIDRVRDGRSFCTRSVKASQNGVPIFIAQVSFQKKETDTITHQCKFPSVPEPESLTDALTLMQQALQDPHKPDSLSKRIIAYKHNDLDETYEKIFESRPVDPKLYLYENIGTTEPPKAYWWVKAHGPVGDQFALHRSLAAYMSDCFMIETALMPHIAAGFVPSMVFSLDHCMYFHRPEFKVDEWMLYEICSRKAVGGRTYSDARIWTREKDLVLSVTQEGIVRKRRN
uniref:Acyl-CoA thioesterase II n=1 Tax=Steinernema glaseri TaxID=37863 RepID=A0A1I7ZT65_9BILA